MLTHFWCIQWKSSFHLKNVNSANIQNHLDQSKLFSKYSHRNKGLDIGQKDGTQLCVMIRGYHQFSPMAETKTIVYCCNVASPADFSVFAFCFLFVSHSLILFPEQLKILFSEQLKILFSEQSEKKCCHLLTIVALHIHFNTQYFF